MRQETSDLHKPMKHSISIAPMMDWTDRHCRYFLRLVSPHALLYTEMVTAAALKHGDAGRLLRFNEEEHPVALQLGGGDPELMAEAARLGAAEGYDEFNINVGCPSDRVQSGQFGACLMAEPERIAACVRAMRSAAAVPVTVKTRIGIDDRDSYGFLCAFVETVAEAGCRSFILHARKALLDGLSPKENRSVPPLDYERVYRLKREYPELTVTLNGGVAGIEQVIEHLRHVDGVMIGREAYQNPWLLTELERAVYGVENVPDRQEVLAAMGRYIERELRDGVALKQITRHLLGLFNGQPGAKAWRRYLSEHSQRPGAGIEVVHAALERLSRAA
ncbi:MAG: tRNA dihydrouridine(20/20a) synthase DusA [Woeseiaceae bacterium]